MVYNFLGKILLFFLLFLLVVSIGFLKLADLDNFIVSIASKFVASILTLIAVAIVILKIDLILGLMILLIQSIIMILSKKISQKTGLLKKEENKAIEEFQNNINETLDLFGQIKASNKENFFFQDSISKASNIQKTSNEFFNGERIK